MVVWGIDLLGNNWEVKVEKPVENLTLPEIKTALSRYDWILSALEEETDLDHTYQRGGKINPREESAKKARELKTAISSSGSIYHKLLARFAALAIDDLDKRIVNLSERRSMYEWFLSDSSFDEQKKAVLSAYRNRRLAIEGLGEVGLDRVGSLLQSHPNSAVRKSLYLGSRGLDDIEALVHKEIDGLNELVRRESQSHDFFKVRSAYCEVDPTIVEQMMRDFVAGTKEVYETLFRELITTKKVMPWDVGFMIAQKDPFSALPVPQDPSTLFAIGLTLLREIGYDPWLVEQLYKPRDGVYIDIEEREGKGPGAFTCSLGPFSHGKNILFYQPRSFGGNARHRWTVFPHELGHGIHHEMSRKASAQHGPIFFIENTVGCEVVSKFHDALPLEEAFFGRYFTGTDLKFLRQWQTFGDLSAAYGIIRLSLGDITMHTKGVHAAREGFHEGYELVRSELVDHSLGPSSAYVLTHHVFDQPAYLFTYFLADLYRLALLQTARESHGALITPQTAPFLVDKIMTGNLTSMHNRVVRATGTTDIVGNAVQCFKDAAK